MLEVVLVGHLLKSDPSAAFAGVAALSGEDEYDIDREKLEAISIPLSQRVISTNCDLSHRSA